MNLGNSMSYGSNNMTAYGDVPYVNVNQMEQLNGYMNQIKGQSSVPYQLQMQQPNVNSQIRSNMEFIKVTNKQQAKEWVVQNNTEVWMQDSSEPYLYYKSVDNLGSANFRVLRVDDITRIIDDYKENKGEPPSVMLQLWQFEHEQLIDDITEIKKLQDYYKSL